MKRELRFLPSARAGMPELAGAGDRFVKRREPSHPALRATISRVGWSPGVPFGMEKSLWASRPPARYRRGAPVPPEHHSSTTSGDRARLSASGVARVDLRFRHRWPQQRPTTLWSKAAWSPLARLSSSSPPAANHGELDAGDLPAIGTTARSCPASIWGTTPAMYLADGN
jgi:hypothetical protein